MRIDLCGFLVSSSQGMIDIDKPKGITRYSLLSPPLRILQRGIFQATKIFIENRNDLHESILLDAPEQRQAES
jgi:hypothetical protein